MNLDIEQIRQFLQAHAETILTWLVAGLVMMLLAKFELRRAVRKSAQAMSESVATTVAACVPDIAHAAQTAHPVAVDPDGAEPVTAQRADALRRLSLDTVATVMARGRWLEDVGNLRLAEDALLTGRRAGGADPLLVVAPQPVVQAYLTAQRTFEDEAARLQTHRREALTLQEALQALVAEAAHVEQETASIVMRFEQVNAQAAQGVEAGDYQRFLIQKYNQLGQREKDIGQERAELAAQLRESTDALAEHAHVASQRYTQALAPLMQQLRSAWGHGDSPDVFETWLRHAKPEDGMPAPAADRSAA
ncbi:hypothetical protein SAMN05216321_107171 [Cupriavidus sp. OV038]|uniref:hypothetical protein n=1 Tax=unclassified Cupriavidus TaxID=2640874 RepID=UPI0008ED3880|nr:MULTISPECIES: hypothetical protein [unclassified Cupriavidus]SFC83351.1 hypothetical protein SAMN05216321_107171 [Cupriavidus sp. OV038]SFO79483.1 hypothetical protein SAMN05216322_102505 [Cupriavidus sp. OV096]